MFQILLFVTVVVLVLIYLIGLHNENYWKRRGVVFHKKNKVGGVLWDFVTKDRALFQHLYDIYKAYPKEPAVGFAAFLTPALYVKDPVNIQYVLTKNFNAFNHRGIEGNDGDLLAQTFLFQTGKKWKLVRQSMTPLFTATKLKSMYYILDRSAQDFVECYKDNPKLMNADTFANLSSYCNAAIGATVFGLTSDSIFSSPFLHVVKSASKPNLMRNIKFAIGNTSLFLFKILKIKLFAESEEFFIGAIKQVVQQRESDNVKKHDFADLCVSLQKKGMLKDDQIGLEVEPTYELLAAQAFFFFVAGVDATATSMFVTLVELGRHPEYLERVHKEIDEAFESNDGNMSYDAVADMEFLDMAMSEAMRLYPPVGFLTRLCIEDAVLPVGNIKVDKGTKIFTPIFELHHDPQYYKDPEVYDPERFSRENIHKISDATYMPFGGGNRICIGPRYARMQAKAGIVHLLRNFTIKTHVGEGGIKYSKEQVQVRLTNVHVEIMVRNK